MTMLFPSHIFRYIFFFLLTTFHVSLITLHSRQTENDALHVAIAIEIASLDPQITSSIAAIKVQSAIYETLVNISPEDGRIIPGMCKTWEVSDDRKTYRFYLREHAKWTDGTSVTASDYYFAFKRLLDPSLGAPFANLYYPIESAEAYHSGDLDNFEEVGVRVLAEHTLEIKLEKRVPYFLSLLARPCSAALHQKWILEKGDFNSRTSSWSLGRDFPSCGAYILDEWTVNKWIKLKKNPSYWNSEAVSVEDVFFYPMESEYTQEQAFKAGVIDVTSKLAAELIPLYIQDPSYIRQTEMGTFYIILNTESAKFQSVPFRSRISQSINRKGICETIRKRGEQPAYSFVPPLWGDAFPPSDPPNPVLSEKVNLSEPLRLLIPSSENNNVIAEAVQEMIQTQLGVRVDIYRQEWKSYLDSRNRGQFDLCLATWIGDYFDPLTFLEMWTADNPNNFCNWKNEEFDSLLSRAAESDNTSRFKLLKQAENLLISETAIIPLFYLSRVYLVSTDLNTWPQSILNTVDYSLIRLNRR